MVTADQLSSLQDGPTVLQAQNPVHGFSVTVTPPVWQASTGEEIHRLLPHVVECYTKAPS